MKATIFKNVINKGKTMEENKDLKKPISFYIKDTEERDLVKSLIKFIRDSEDSKKELMRLFSLTK
jgi:hypothetical protein